MAVDLTRQASAGAVAFSAVIPVIDMNLIGHRVGFPAMPWAVGITACYLPGLHDRVDVIRIACDAGWL